MLGYFTLNNFKKMTVRYRCFSTAYCSSFSLPLHFLYSISLGPTLTEVIKNPLPSHTMLTMIHTKGSLHKARWTTYPVSVNKWSSTLSHCIRSHCFNVVSLHLEGLSWYLPPLNPVALQNLYQRMVNGKGLSSKSQHTHTLIQTLHDFSPALSPTVRHSTCRWPPVCRPLQIGCSGCLPPGYHTLH